MPHWLRNRTSSEFPFGLLIVLVLIVLLPTMAVLWLVGKATQNEHLAVRQRLIDVYQAQLDLIRRQVEEGWSGRLETFESLARGQTPSGRFATCVMQGFADSVIVLDEHGKPAYPTVQTLHTNPSPKITLEWVEAERLELTVRDRVAAAKQYQQIAEKATDDIVAARAIQAQARSLLEAGDADAARDVLSRQRTNDRLQLAVAEDGRWIYGDLMLLLITLAKDSDPKVASETADELAKYANDYSRPTLQSAQRRFLMRELQQLAPSRFEFPTLPTEELAAEFLERTPNFQSTKNLKVTILPDIYQVASANGRVLGLFRTKSISAQLRQVLERQPAPADTRIQITHANSREDKDDEFLSVSLGPTMPGWRLALTLTGNDPLAAAARQHTRLYLWAGFVTIGGTSVLAILLGAILRRHLRLAEIKNDLVANVSHELKTPLAGIRLLIDTMLEKQPDQQRVQEYLQLMSQETGRLGRLIDNFLTFSRLERRKQNFVFEAIAPADLVRRAQDAIGERLAEQECRLELNIDPNLPDIRGDMDALVTALVNLMDNACKYGGTQKRILLRARLAQNRICIAVQDNGIGLSPHDKKHIFDRFYQADRRLVRSAGGCGLGLSIVRHIMAAHDGVIDVQSEPGQGSTFTLLFTPMNTQTTSAS